MRLPDGSKRVFGDRDSTLQGEMEIHDLEALRRLLVGGEVGGGEAYMDGLWSSPDLVGLISMAVANREALVATTTEKFGGIDGLIQVAAFEDCWGGLFNADFDKWRKAYDVNVIGALTVMRAVVPAMKERGKGSVVLIGSQSMFTPTLDQPGYAATKGALLTTARYLADFVRARAELVLALLEAYEEAHAVVSPRNLDSVFEFHLHGDNQNGMMSLDIFF